MIAANERKASRFRLVTFLATVAILRTFQYGPNIIGKVYYDRALLDFDGTCKSLASVEIQQKMGYFLMVRELLDLSGFHTFPLQLYVTFDFLKNLFIVANCYQILIKHMPKFSWCGNLTTIRILFDCTIMV